MYSRRKGNFIILLVTIVLAVVLIGLFAWDKQNQLETSADEMIEKQSGFGIKVIMKKPHGSLIFISKRIILLRIVRRHILCLRNIITNWVNQVMH